MVAADVVELKIMIQEYDFPRSPKADHLKRARSEALEFTHTRALKCTKAFLQHPDLHSNT